LRKERYGERPNRTGGRRTAYPKKDLRTAKFPVSECCTTYPNLSEAPFSFTSLLDLFPDILHIAQLFFSNIDKDLRLTLAKER
jgi:hypothetical protein